MECRQPFLSSDKRIERAFRRIAFVVFFNLRTIFFPTFTAFVFFRARTLGPGQSVSLPRLMGFLCTASVH